ncbi:hypothetical protein AAFF_G00075930 [Aldrovandia affinis]|uniref:Uncharacterized protein n=1 Tax=Aldrovandia affinis TaxID=143900 RepID=A0AAD7RY19_9TELE|nr:hypothetical protein AAFF_G00075930 [Aldrovandia affinis]
MQCGAAQCRARLLQRCNQIQLGPVTWPGARDGTPANATAVSKKTAEEEGGVGGRREETGAERSSRDQRATSGHPGDSTGLEMNWLTGPEAPRGVKQINRLINPVTRARLALSEGRGVRGRHHVREARTQAALQEDDITAPLGPETLPPRCLTLGPPAPVTAPGRKIPPPETCPAGATPV